MTACVCFVLLVICRVFGLIAPFSVPTAGMAPTIQPGDHVLSEGFTYLACRPGRGDVVVFQTDGIAWLPPATFVKRLAGLPGDRVRIADGRLFINDLPVSLSNSVGANIYRVPAGSEPAAPWTNVTVPAGHYYVLGDNSTNSADSRFWGCVPACNIKGRIVLCFWPPHRMGAVR